MKIGIIAAMEEEVRFLVETLTQKQQTTIANQVFYEGMIDDIDVVVVQSGIGKVNAALATTLLIDHFKSTFVINSGSAGGIGEGLKVGDLVVSSQLTYNDADATAFGYKFGQIPQMPETYSVDKNAYELTKETGEELGWTVHVGEIVTGDSFIASQDRISEIKNYFKEALVTEMEGAAVGQTCFQFNVPFIVIRAVSDTGDEEANVTFDEFIIQAGKDSASLVIHLIKNIKALNQK